MKTRHLALVPSLLLLATALGTLSAASAPPPAAGSIEILAPGDRAEIDAGEAYPLEYSVVLGPGDDHFHVWVDAERSPGIHDRKGTYRLPKMTPGSHVITLKLVDKTHVPTGPQKSITVTVK